MVPFASISHSIYFDVLVGSIFCLFVKTEIHLINSNEISKDLYDTFYDAACESNYLTFSSD